jgi:hypothetical protein
MLSCATAAITTVNTGYEIKDIDGVGGILGQAQPLNVRDVGRLAAASVMRFDKADVVSNR